MNPKRKTIAMVSNTAWYLYNLRLGVIRFLRSKGFDIIAIAPRDEFIASLQRENCKTVVVEMDRRGTNPIADFALMFKLWKIYRAEKPAFIIHYTIKPNVYGSLAAWLAGIPSLAVVSGLGYAFSKRGWLYRVAASLMKIAFSKAQEVWFVNKDDRDLLLEARIVDERKTRQLPGEGIDTTKFSPSPKPASNGKFVFLLSARLLWEKGVGTFVEAARRLKPKYPNADFQLLGFLTDDASAGVTQAQMDEWQREGVVKYLGSTSDVVPFLSAADCVLLPSFYREGVPRALLEAASLAKPIITTDNVGCRDVVEDGVTGFLAKPNDVASLAEKMEAMLNLPESARLEMGRKAREKAIREFDERLVLQEYDAMLKRFGLA
ncbi:MAG: glycosyltransferase family 4 protein [Chloroherpetonaceae bacterium]|nr:glycosyltransferase family 4 protein [Chloroherpetonaceae bacterium]MDW8436670.1 glycosyltransferase family 4 protein [Chloroherpetonaceae bacterium]